MNGWNAPPPRGVSAALRQAPLAARQLKGSLLDMRSSIYSCGTLADTRNSVDYSSQSWSDVFLGLYAPNYNFSDMRYWLDMVSLGQFLGLPTHDSLKEEVKEQQSDMAEGVFLELSIDRFKDRFRV